VKYPLSRRRDLIFLYPFCNLPKTELSETAKRVASVRSWTLWHRPYENESVSIKTFLTQFLAIAKVATGTRFPTQARWRGPLLPTSRLAEKQLGVPQGERPPKPHIPLDVRIRACEGSTERRGGCDIRPMSPQRREAWRSPRPPAVT